VIVGPEDGRRIALGVQALRVLSEGTAGLDVAIVDTTLPPGSGAPRHVHHDHEEAFFVIDGTVRIRLDGEEVVSGPGGIVVAERGQVHAFTNVGEGPARLLALYSPASRVTYLDDLAEILDAPGGFDQAAMDAFYERYASGPG
jgi:quercetin dioxygenase-like cupin family protein